MDAKVLEQKPLKFLTAARSDPGGLTRARAEQGRAPQLQGGGDCTPLREAWQFSFAVPPKWPIWYCKTALDSTTCFNFDVVRFQGLDLQL